MKSFSVFLTENNFDTVKSLMEGFEDKSASVLSLYKTITAEYNTATEASEKVRIIEKYGPELLKALKSCIPVSATERKFFTPNQARAIRAVLTKAKLADDDATDYLDLSDASEDERNEWENSISIKASGTDKKESEDSEEDDGDEPDAGEPADSEVDPDEEDDDLDDKKVEVKASKNSKDDVKLERNASELADRMLAKPKDAVAEKVTKKAICIIHEQIEEDTPSKGTLGLTSLVEHSILGLTSEEEVKDAIISPINFKSERDFVKKLKVLQDGHKIKVFFFNPLVEDEDPWNVELI